MMVVHKNISEKKIVLQMKRWRLHFSDEEIKQMIAIALNKTIRETNIRLKGYFITNWRIYLVLDVLSIDEQEFLTCFLNELQKSLRVHAVKHHELEQYFHEKEIYKNVKGLFRFYHYFDVRLCDLLTGRVEQQVYEDPYVEQMRQYLSYYNYASYRNYQGEKGPVIFPIRGFTK